MRLTKLNHGLIVKLEQNDEFCNKKVKDFLRIKTYNFSKRLIYNV